MGEKVIALIAFTSLPMERAITRAITSPGVGGGSSFTPISATGGTITDTTIGGRAWRYHTFTASGNFVVSSLGTDPNVSYLAVGSGGVWGRMSRISRDCWRRFRNLASTSGPVSAGSGRCRPRATM